jgi:hypothetical protein
MAGCITRNITVQCDVLASIYMSGQTHPGVKEIILKQHSLQLSLYPNPISISPCSQIFKNILSTTVRPSSSTLFDQLAMALTRRPVSRKPKRNNKRQCSLQSFFWEALCSLAVLQTQSW